MRIGGSAGPRLLHLSWTLWRSKPRRRYRVLPCGHAHRTQAAYEDCLRRKKVAR
jgi:hypothetical protein